MHPTSTDLLHLRRCRQTAATALAAVAVAVKTVAAAATVSAALTTAMSTAHRCRADSAATALGASIAAAFAAATTASLAAAVATTFAMPTWDVEVLLDTLLTGEASAAGAAGAASSARLLAGRAAIRASLSPRSGVTNDEDHAMWARAVLQRHRPRKRARATTRWALDLREGGYVWLAAYLLTCIV